MLKERCKKNLRLLAIVSPNKNFGADNNLLMLDKIQYSASITVIGALRCTFTNSIESAADLIPLEYRRTELMLRYYVRTIGTPDHPFTKLIKNYYHFQFYENSPYPLPVTGKILKIQ